MSVSFSAAAKAEMCKNIPTRHCCALAQCFGILLFCNSFGGDGIRIITESREFAGYLPKLFKKAFGLTFDSVPDPSAGGKLSFRITDEGKLRTIMSAYGFDPEDTLSVHINLAAVEEDCCKAAFLRGAFLAGGSVTDPSRAYHLELATTHHSVAREGNTLILEAVGLTPKAASRGGGQVLYFKQSDSISDLLAYLGAPVAAMGIIEARMEKELKNTVNRRCNCDEANTSKVVEAAQEQLSAIRVLREMGLFETLPPKLAEAALAREKNPEYNLTELAGLMDPPISKPAMNNRMKNLVRMAKEVSQ